MHVEGCEDDDEEKEETSEGSRGDNETRGCARSDVLVHVGSMHDGVDSHHQLPLVSFINICLQTFFPKIQSSVVYVAAAKSSVCGRISQI